MARASLRLMFFVTGLGFIVRKLGDLIVLNLGDIFCGTPPGMVALILCLPAVLLGSAAWWRVRSFARSWPVVLCIVIAWAGLFYGGPRENHRGVVNATYLTIVLPVAALIVEHRCWWLCARTFVLANAFALGLALWFEYRTRGLTLLTSLGRFGYLWSDDGSARLSSPNSVGGQLALAAVLAFILYLRKGTRVGQAQDAPVRPQRFSLGWTVFLSLGCILTASRGAFVAWFGGMALLFWGARTQKREKLRGLVALSGVLLPMIVFVAVATGFKPWGTLQARFADKESVLGISGRAALWKGAFDIWRSNPQYFLVGVGAGLAPETLGPYLGITEPDGVTSAAADCHNFFVEWGLNFGLVGMVAGVCLLAAACRKARQLDRRDGTVNRQAILLCFCLTAMTYVALFELSSVAYGSLILAMLSEPPPVTPAKPATHSENSSLLRPTMRRARWLRAPRPRVHSNQFSSWSES